MPFLTLSGADVDFLNPSGAPVEDLHHRRGLSNYRIHQASESERVAAAELDPKHETHVVHVGSVNSDVSLSSSSGSYKDLR